MTAALARFARLPDRRPLLRAVGFVLLVNVVGGLPGLLSSPDTDWFRRLEKPWFYPPSVAFPIVWTALFTLLGIALWLVWRSENAGRRFAIGLFVLQMACNVAWTPAFFALEAPLLALGIILALWALVAATIVAFRRVDRRAAALLAPYLLWVTFAAVLNFELWRANA
ncbi:tryptophan-rich sensory protein [Haloterrigena sp. SYSU A558-1]|uniref:Tryptophan-rich sensory protein n=1 Tax=Haloterrigena gelatinilytica TaxID=2741724 RepID=A0A8J8GI13_9EURY|nr:TspO/MBR family protein [Haloterrigena gelatinilytica]NUB90036.1 tryptophan-rich sensory protein [Haloterrigena gelatinilytica]NUC74139.1 tryptophan-rich sensory protein [Haloterrigena gelatinilytica]